MMLAQMVPATILSLAPAGNKEQFDRGLDQLIMPIKNDYLTQVHVSIAAELNTSCHKATKDIPTLMVQCQANLKCNYTTANLTTLKDNMPCKTEPLADMANTIVHQLRQAPTHSFEDTPN